MKNNIPAEIGRRTKKETKSSRLSGFFASKRDVNKYINRKPIPENPMKPIKGFLIATKSITKTTKEGML